MTSQMVAVFGSSAARPGEPDFESAVRLGALLASAGYGVVNGGYAGLMEAVSIGASRVGGEVLGITAPDLFPDRPGGNAYLTTELQAASLTERIHELVQRSCAAVVLPGSIGTLTELAVYWNEAFIANLRGAPERPVVTVGAKWQAIIPYLVDELATRPDLVHLARTVDEAYEFVHARLASTP